VTRQPVDRNGNFSPAGWSRLQFIDAPACELCGAPFAMAPLRGKLCAPCAAPRGFQGQLCGPGLLDRLRSALVYDDESAALILQLKYGDRHDLGPALGRLVAGALGRLDPAVGAVLLPIPLHPRRQRQRGYNQSALLAHAAGRLTGLRVRQDLMARKKATPQQKGLGSLARRRNLTGAFQADPKAQGCNIVLVDDVLTSGATLVSAARTLRRAGAASVMAVTVARVFKGGAGVQADLPEL
jgi:ComF family protein